MLGIHAGSWVSNDSSSRMEVTTRIPGARVLYAGLKHLWYPPGIFLSILLPHRALFWVPPMEWKNPGRQQMNLQCGMRKYTANLGIVGASRLLVGVQKIGQLVS